MRAELARVLASPTFATSPSHQRMLRYLVEHLLAGDTRRLKESVLGIEVFQRSPASYDPAQDSIVRVEARRLRQRLARHYAGVADSGLRIELPAGGYVPRIVTTDAGAAVPAAADAAEYVARGEFCLGLAHEEGWRMALERFGDALALEPERGAALRGTAAAWWALIGAGATAAGPALEMASQAIERALVALPGDERTLLLGALVRHEGLLDWPGARSLLDQAVARHPRSGAVRVARARAWTLRRRFDEAWDELRHIATASAPEALRLAAEAEVEFARGNLGGAERLLRTLLALHPPSPALLRLPELHLLRGEALAALERCRHVQQVPALALDAQCGVAEAQAMLGDAAQARQTLQRLSQERRGRALPGMLTARVELRLGDTGRALAELERAVEERDPRLLRLATDPVWEPLRETPRFKTLEKRLRLWE